MVGVQVEQERREAAEEGRETAERALHQLNAAQVELREAEKIQAQHIAQLQGELQV